MALDLTALPRYPPIPSTSREPVKALVRAFEEGKPVDPVASGATAAMAFTSTSLSTTGDPKRYDYEVATTDWKPATFESSGDGWFVRCLVGSGGGVVTLPIGEYVVWATVIDSPEAPVRAVGLLQVT